MVYEISFEDRQTLSLFVPDWFVEAVLQDTEEDKIKNKIIEELRISHKLLGRDEPEDVENKADDLYATYLDVIEEYKVSE